MVKRQTFRDKTLGICYNGLNSIYKKMLKDFDWLRGRQLKVGQSKLQVDSDWLIKTNERLQRRIRRRLLSCTFIEAILKITAFPE